jgi:hypothetical protein
MPFKFFQKRDITPTSDTETPNLVPATPKMRLSGFLRPPNTPSLTDGSLRGEQKRTGLLELQLKEVSLTASKAYDKVEDLTMKNNMLQDQVLQQKQLIESFTIQLEEANKEKQEFMMIQQDKIKQTIEEHHHAIEMISKLDHEKDVLYRENQRLQDEIDKLHQMYNDNSILMKQAQAQDKYEHELKIKAIQLNQKDKDTPIRESSQMLLGQQQSLPPEYRELIDQLKKKINDLEDLIKKKDDMYQQSIITFQNTMHVLNNNKKFLEHPNISNSKDFDYLFDDNVSDRGDGDTYILNNISFH